MERKMEGTSMEEPRTDQVIVQPTVQEQKMIQNRKSDEVLFCRNDEEEGSYFPDDDTY
jgi:hypothetical protein